MAILIFFFIFALAASPVAAQPITETLRLRVEQLHDGGASSIRGARLIRRDAVAHFFQQRGFEPAWRIPFASDRIRRAIAEIRLDGLNPPDYHLAAIDALLAAGAARSSADEADLQLLLTDAIAALVDHVRYGKVRPVTLDRRWNVDPRQGTAPLEQEIARIAGAASLSDAIAARRPDHFIYRGLVYALAQLRAIETAGGWPAVAPGPTLKPGAADPRVAQVRARLLASGDLAAGMGRATASRPVLTDHVYDPRLEEAVRRFQDHHRLTADGAIGRATVDAMNVNVGSRIEQVRANIERARWVLGGLQDTFLLVNLPAFKVYYIREGKNVWEFRTQIGREPRAVQIGRAHV